MAESMDVEISLPRLVAKGKSVFRRVAGNTESVQDYYRINAYYPAIERKNKKERTEINKLMVDLKQEKIMINLLMN